MDSNNTMLKKNDKVVIRLVDGSHYEGELLLETDVLIRLKNTSRVECKKKTYLADLLFKKKEITKFVKKVSDLEEIQVNGYMNIPQNEITSVSNCNLPKTVLDHILNMIDNYIIVSVNDCNYQKFLKDLSSCRFVGISSLGFINGRMSNPSLISFNLDGKRIIVLDLIELKSSKINPFKENLRFVLKSNKIEKIMHCSKFFVDFLVHQQNICVNNLFDTNVTNMYLNQENGQNSSDTNMLSYTECLVKYFQLPENFFSQYTKSSVIKLKRKLYKRPLDDDLLNFLVYNTAFLIALRNKLHSLIMKPFWNDMNKWTFSYCNHDTAQHKSSSSADFV